MMGHEPGKPERKILHLDMDAYYASIEQRDRPELRGRPVIVGGSPDQRGVVSTCSYEARRYGVHSAMPSRTARRLCPQAVFLPPRFSVYKAVSQQIMQIFRSYTDLVEPLSLDEAYLDVTTNKMGFSSATLLARELKQRIYQQTKLTVSAGVSFNKFLAKVGSDFHKPDGLTVVTREQAEQFLAALPVSKFFGVGRVTTAKLEGRGILTGADLKLLTVEQLYRLLGKQGLHLYQLVRGEDQRAVEPERIRKSVGKEITLLKDISDRAEMLDILERLARQVEARLKELDVSGRTITLKIKFADFEQITRRLTLAQPLQEADAMLPHLRLLLAQIEQEPRLIRLLGVTLSTLAEPATKARLLEYATPSLWEI